VLHATEALRLSVARATLQIQRVSQVPTVSEEPAAARLLSRSITLIVMVGAVQAVLICPDRFDLPFYVRHQRGGDLPSVISATTFSPGSAAVRETAQDEPDGGGVIVSR
jgi:hypothetical protein